MSTAENQIQELASAIAAALDVPTAMGSDADLMLLRRRADFIIGSLRVLASGEASAAGAILTLRDTLPARNPVTYEVYKPGFLDAQ
ncbi:MAG: hypothetical protein ACYCPF_22225 [Streptosporangiaceae bacterium]